MEAKFVSVDNTQAYVATNDKHLVVAFRGSEGPTGIDGLKDWLLTNALNLLIQPEGKLSTDFLAAGVGAKFHQGFVSAITEVWGTLFPLVDAEVKAKDRGVWVTGHSLGGSLALLGAWLLKRKFVPIDAVYTFGAQWWVTSKSRRRSIENSPARSFVTSTRPIRCPCCQ